MISPKTSGKKTSSKEKASASLTPFLLGCGIAVALTGVICWLATSNRRERVGTAIKVPKKPTKISQAVSNAVPFLPQQDEDPGLDTPRVAEAKRMYLGSEVIRTALWTNGDIIVERLYTADGKRHRINHIPPSIFKHASDEYLGIVLSTPPGVAMAPLPDLSREGGLEKAFLESLDDEVIINDEDGAENRDTKLKVIAARESMGALLREGMSFAEVLETERTIHNKNIEIRSQVSAEYRNLLEQGYEEDAETFRKKMNAQLSKMGIEEIPEKQ